MSEVNKAVTKGKVRLFYEVMYEFEFSHDKPVTVKEAVRKVINEHGGTSQIVERQKAYYVDGVHAAMVTPDDSEDQFFFDSDEDITKLIYEP